MAGEYEAGEESAVDSRIILRLGGPTQREGLLMGVA